MSRLHAIAGISVPDNQLMFASSNLHQRHAHPSAAGDSAVISIERKAGALPDLVASCHRWQSPGTQGTQ